MATFYFDMDGTIADLYSVSKWLDYLKQSDPTPYRTATPMVDMNRLAECAKRLHSRGHKLEVITWGAKNSTSDYLLEVARAKRNWVAHYAPSVFDAIHVLPYGEPKWTVCHGSNHAGLRILFDDERPNRDAWNAASPRNLAAEPAHIFSTLETFSFAA